MQGRLNTWLLILVTICALSWWLGRDLVLTGKEGSAVWSPPTGAPATFASSAEETSSHEVVLNGTSELGMAREVS